MKNAHHLRLDYDFTKKDIDEVFALARKLKSERKKGILHPLLPNKSLAMIFQKASTRTRVSFEVAMTELGGHALNLSPNDLQLSRGETIADTARVLSRYCHGIMARVFSHNDIEELSRNATIPVINGLCDLYHPCQALTDYFTIWEKRKTLKGLHLVFMGDGDNNVTNSLLLTGVRLGMSVTVICPPEYKTKQIILNAAKEEAKKTGATIVVTSDISAVKHADVIYTDVWVSMGREDAQARKKAFAPYQVNSAVLARAPKDVLIMHCLPAHRGEEITDEVIDGKNSIVFDQAENRLHIQKAILVKLLSKL